jgi:hypothetical protein
LRGQVRSIKPSLIECILSKLCHAIRGTRCRLAPPDGSLESPIGQLASGTGTDVISSPMYNVVLLGSLLRNLIDVAICTFLVGILVSGTPPWSELSGAQRLSLSTDGVVRGWMAHENNGRPKRIGCQLHVVVSPSTLAVVEQPWVACIVLAGQRYECQPRTSLQQ